MQNKVEQLEDILENQIGRQHLEIKHLENEITLEINELKALNMHLTNFVNSGEEPIEEMLVPVMRDVVSVTGEVEDPSKVFINSGVHGFYAEMDLEEAIEFNKKRINLLEEKRSNTLRKKAINKTKSRMLSEAISILATGTEEGIL